MFIWLERLDSFISNSPPLGVKIQSHPLGMDKSQMAMGGGEVEA